jgi:hypothetical protein
MAYPQSFLDNLENVRLVTSVALEHVQRNRPHFAREATGEQIRLAEERMAQLRVLAAQFDNEFKSLEAQFLQRGRELA